MPSFLHCLNPSGFRSGRRGTLLPKLCRTPPPSQFFFPCVGHTHPLPGLGGIEDAELSKVRPTMWRHIDLETVTTGRSGRYP